MNQTDDRTFMRKFGGIIIGLMLITVVIFILANSLQDEPSGSANPSHQVLAEKRISPVSGVRVGDEGAAALAEAQPAPAETAAESGAEAIDGGQVYNSLCMTCHDAGVGKSEKLIPMVREHYGNEWSIYSDSNGYYDVEGAVKIGRLLQENKYSYFEEPVMFDHFEDIKRVADALDIPVANGEQDHSFTNFSWLLANDGIDVLQPDNYYFGGMIRSIKVARMAEAFGKTFTPHMSGGGLGYLYNCHIVSVCPNAG